MAGISPEDMIQMSEEVPEEDADEDLSILSPEPDLDGQKSKKTIRDLKKRISTLKANLASAVDEENYEKASEIRDMLETLEKNLDEE
jgi:excinuclease UvrABC helicase subunit UvrB